MTIFEKIEQKGQKEADLIIKKAHEEAEAIKLTSLEKAQKRASKIVQDERLKQNQLLEQKKGSFELEKRQEILFEKAKQIDLVMEKLRTHIVNLKGEELLKYTAKLIKQEDIIGDEVIRVSKIEYDKYLSALSTAKKDQVVILDKLNNVLGKEYQLKLENVDADIDNGFLIVGKLYDLNFSIDPYIKTLRETYEKQIYDVLFN